MKKVKSPYETIAEQKECISLLLGMCRCLNQILDIQPTTYVNIMLDACAMANADVFQMGCGRAKKWRDTMEQYLQEFDQAAADEVNEHINYKGVRTYEGDPEVTATRAAIYARLKWIYNGEIDDFETRYNWGHNQQVYAEYNAIVQKLDKYGIVFKGK